MLHLYHKEVMDSWFEGLMAGRKTSIAHSDSEFVHQSQKEEHYDEHLDIGKQRR